MHLTAHNLYQPGRITSAMGSCTAPSATYVLFTKNILLTLHSTISRLSRWLATNSNASMRNSSLVVLLKGAVYNNLVIRRSYTKSAKKLLRSELNLQPLRLNGNGCEGGPLRKHGVERSRLRSRREGPTSVMQTGSTRHFWISRSDHTLLQRVSCLRPPSRHLWVDPI